MPRVLPAVIACLVVCSKLAQTAEDGYCFRLRDPIGGRGKCRDMIEKAPDSTAIKTAAECCRLGGVGWAVRRSGKKCADACLNVDDQDVEVVPPQVNREEDTATKANVERSAANGADQVIQVQGVWAQWSEWEDCSVTCGSGFRERRRECRPPRPSETQEEFQCEGDTVEHRPCNTRIRCPVHGQWGEWSDWTECSATCGDNMARYRECNSPAPRFGGNECVGDATQVEWCNGRRNCPIDGGWKAWSSWSSCSVTCGRQGEQRRFRRCTEPSPKYGGRDCLGDAISIRHCKPFTRNCPVDGGWSEWGPWTCPVECANGGHGWAVRRRQCTNPLPEHGGRYCEGMLLDTTRCSRIDCPVDGSWSSWESWSDCSSTCGSHSFQNRRRRCDNPPPETGGLDCIGSPFEMTSCELDPCPSTDYSDGGGTSEQSSMLCDDEDYTSEDGASGCRQSGSGDGEDSDSVSDGASFSSIYSSPEYE